MLSLLKTSLCSSGTGSNSSPSTFHRHHGPVVEEDDEHAVTVPSSCGSCGSLVDIDSLSSNTSSLPSTTSSSNGSGGLMKRSPLKSSYALTALLQHDADKHTNLSTSLTAAIVAEATCLKAISPAEFGRSLESAIQQGGGDFHNRTIRQALELPLRQARTMRDSCRRASNSNDPMPLSSWVGLPYAGLRDERPFLYDHMHTHPLSELLSRTLEVPDLTQMHQSWNPQLESAQDHQRRVFRPLLDRQRRRDFHQAYDSFVASCCLPLLHAAALRGNVFNSSNRQHHTVHNDPVVYHYQVFPTIHVVYPNDLEACRPPSCDLVQGKSVGWLHFHVPLTASQGTSALYCENFPGKEDWHALRCTQVGLGYCWDGARCLSFVPLNTTGKTRVSLDFRILLVRASTAKSCSSSPMMRQLSSRLSDDEIDDDTLCRPHHLQDSLTRSAGFYKEVTMESVVGGGGGTQVDPDARCGFPFSQGGVM